MDSILDVKEALQARSTTASLEDLRSQGRKKVRIIRAEHVAHMIEEAVQRALQNSGLVDKAEVDRLVTDSRREFLDVMREREAEVSRARETAEELEQVRGQRDRALARIAELEAGMAQAGAPSGDIVMKLMSEVATLKAGMAQPQVGGAADQTLTAALEKLTGNLNDRLEKFGRKMGISSAVEADDVKFDRLFAKDNDQAVESNIDSVQMKQKTGGGIAANLERLRKLKGGG